MRKGLFITGTDTNVGKTVASAALMHRYRGQAGVRYWKPIQTGIEQDDDTAEVRRLGACVADEILDKGVRLRKPVSPHLAARLAGVTIDVEELADLLPEDSGSAWVVEGAGGLLVPVSERETIADCIWMLGLPVLVVARSGLGTINHTTLTLEALRARSLTVAGVLMIGERNAENRAAIEHYGRVKVLGEMPVLDPLNAETLALWSKQELDPDGQLLKFLQ
jgi:malonyl-CoA O-methyltransferase